jgi:hypothetical protein
MSRIARDPDEQLEASLQRIRGALERNRNVYASVAQQILESASPEVVDRVKSDLSDRQERRQRRQRRREEKRLERHGDDEADFPGAIVSGAVAIVLVVLALLNPGMWWLVFPGFGIGMGAASRFGRATRARRLERAAMREDVARQEAEASRDASRESAFDRRPAQMADEPRAAGTTAPPTPSADPIVPKVARIQHLCDTILAEIESGPQIVREVVTKPKETIGGLRQACLEIAHRERELRVVLDAQQESEVVAERDALAARIASEQDTIVRERLSQALRAIEQQLAHRADLTTAAARLDAENTRILYTLESLRMQLLRARSTDIGAPDVGGTLRESLRALGTEIDAVAEALEWASAPPDADTNATPTVATPANVDARDSVRGGDSSAAKSIDAAQRERADAARRAAQATSEPRR